MGLFCLPESIYVVMNEESKEALKKYNLEALQKFKIGESMRLYVVLMTPLLVGSHQVPFPMCTLENNTKILQHRFFTLNFLLILL